MATKDHTADGDEITPATRTLTNVGFALIGAVVGEYISSQEGLGYLVYYSGVLYDLNGVWAGIIALMVVALLMDRGVTEIDRRLRW